MAAAKNRVGTENRDQNKRSKRQPPPHLAYSLYLLYCTRLYLEFVEELIFRGILKRGLTRMAELHKPCPEGRS